MGTCVPIDPLLPPQGVPLTHRPHTQRVSDLMTSTYGAEREGQQVWSWAGLPGSRGRGTRFSGKCRALEAEELGVSQTTNITCWFVSVFEGRGGGWGWQHSTQCIHSHTHKDM